MKRLLLISFLSLFYLTAGYGQDACANAEALTPGTPQCGNSAGQAGDFPNGGGAPLNPCSSNYNDDEYWFEYTVGSQDEVLSIVVDNIDMNWAGVFILDGCPNESPSCIAGATNGSSTADLVVSTPILDADSTYYIVIANYGTPDNTSFCMNSSVLTCFEPTGLQTSAITSTSALATWQSDASASYVIEYGLDGFLPGTGTSMATSDTFLMLSSLMSQTDYDVYVRGVCSPGDSSTQDGPASFTTLCGTFTPDYTEDFSSFLPICWERIDAGGPNWVQDDYANATSGPNGKAAKINLYLVQDDTLKSPQFDLSGGGYELVVDLAATEFGSNSADAIWDVGDFVKLLVSEDMGSSWTVLETWDASNNPGVAGITYNQDLSSYTANAQFAFHAAGFNAGSEDIDFFVDNFIVRTPPSCDVPSSLTLDSISGTSTFLSWQTGPSGEIAWDLFYGIDTVAAPDGTTIPTETGVSNNNSYEVISLTPGANHVFYVRANCGASGTSGWVGPVSAYITGPGDDCSMAIPISVVATCDTMSDNEIDFGSAVSVALTSCDNLGPNYGAWYEFTANASGNINLETSSTTGFEAAILDSCGGTEVFCSSLSSTATRSINGLTPFATYYLLIWKDSQFGNASFCLTEGPDCLSPTSGVISNITSTSADVSWQGNQLSTAYTIEYDTSGFAIGTGNTVTGAGPIGGPINLPSLLGNTAYHVYIWETCNGMSTDTLGPISFITLCGAITPPNTEMFNNFLPDCWNEANDGNPMTGPTGLGSGDWVADGFGNVGSTGSARVNLYNVGTSDWLLSPTYDLSGGSGYAVDFDIAFTTFSGTAAGTMGTDDTVQLLISDNGGPWTALITWDSSTTISNTGQNEMTDLTGYTGNVQFAFWASEGTFDDTGDNNFYVDNFRVRIPPACQDPIDLLASDITDTEAAITWTMGGTETNWVVSYNNSGNPAGSGNLISADMDSVYLSGLMDETAYDVYVRAVCNPGDSSPWVGPASFQTLITPPTNDSCTNALMIMCGDSLGGQTTIGATGGLTSSCVGSQGDNVWYVFEGNDNEVTIKVDADITGGFEAQIDVYESASGSCDTLTCIGGSGSGGDPVEFTFVSDLGTTYYIAVGNWVNGDPAGDFGISVTCNTCFDPSGLTIDNITTDQAEVLWNDNPNATGFVIEYGLDGFTLGTGTQVTTGVAGGPITLTPLTPDAVYDVYLYEICGGSNSDTLLAGFTTPPSCPNATALVADNVTSDGATLSWSSAVTTGSWVIEYGQDGFALGTGIEVLVNDTFYDVSGMMPATDYDAYVRVICAVGDSSSLYVGPVSFTTNCGVYVPYFIDSFNTYLPDCWEEGNLGSSSTGPANSFNSDWTSDDFGNVAANGKCAKLNAYDIEEEWLLSPIFDLSMGDYNLTFDIAAAEWNSSTTQAVWADTDTLYLLYTVDSTNWMTLEVWNSGKIPSLTGDSVTIDLSSITSNTVQFGFYYSSFGINSAEDIDVFIDNFEILEIPVDPCPPLLDITNPVDTETYHGDVVNVTGVLVTPNNVSISYETEVNFTDFEVELGAELTTSQLDCP